MVVTERRLGQYRGDVGSTRDGTGVGLPCPTGYREGDGMIYFCYFCAFKERLEVAHHVVDMQLLRLLLFVKWNCWCNSIIKDRGE